MDGILDDSFDDSLDDSVDFVEGADDEDAELHVEHASDDAAEPMSVAHHSQHDRRPTQRHAGPRRPGHRQARIAAMSPAMERKFSGVMSILVTRGDGRQVLFVRKGR